MDTHPPCTVLSSSELYHYLNQVSRSFAITIPFMAAPLKDYVALAYLLCRIVDTVEDDADAAITDKITWLSDFSFLADEEFSDVDVLRQLQQRSLEITKTGSSPDDVALLKDTEAAVNLLLTFDEDVKKVICHGVSILAFGMSSSLRRTLAHEEINNLDDVDNYCYFVAGVVGEMLAELFCIIDPKIDHRELMELAVSFGEGLQLTNILRDRSKDEARGVHFLPNNSNADEIQEFVALTQGHLDDAIEFICTLPHTRCKGMRMFCLTNVAMAMTLLRQVARDPLSPNCDYKISRSKVKRLFILCKFANRSNFMTKLLSFYLSFGMKRQRRNARHLRDKVSIWDHSTTN